MQPFSGQENRLREADLWWSIIVEWNFSVLVVLLLRTASVDKQNNSYKQNNSENKPPSFGKLIEHCVTHNPTAVLKNAHGIRISASCFGTLQGTFKASRHTHS